MYADDAGKPATVPLSAVVPIPSIDNREDTFEELTDPRGTLLQPGAKYWLVISQTTPSEDGNFGVSAWNRFGGFFDELDQAGQLQVDPEEWTGETFSVTSRTG